MRENPRPDAELFGKDHLTQHGRGPRAGVRCQCADFPERNFGNQQNATHGPVTGDAGAGEIVETLAGHLDHRDDPDIGAAGGELIGALRGQGETEVERVAQGRVGRMLEAPDQGHRIQIANGAHPGLAGRKGRQIQTLILSPECEIVARAGSPRRTKYGLVRMVHSSAYSLWYVRGEGRSPAFRPIRRILKMKLLWRFV